MEQCHFLMLNTEPGKKSALNTKLYFLIYRDLLQASNSSFCSIWLCCKTVLYLFGLTAELVLRQVE